MKVVVLKNVQEGMQVARNIYGKNGEILLAKNVILNPRYIQRLEEFGIPALYIHDEDAGEIEIEINDLVSEEIRVQAINIITGFVGSIRLSSQVNLNRVNEVIENILDELLANKDLLVNIIEIRAMNDHTLGHSVNVAILSIITGISMGYNYDTLQRLALGALFHDIGKTLVPENILNMIDPTSEQLEILNSHPQMGFDILRKIEGFSLLSAHVALQHHEKYQGNGFPRQLKGEGISEFARIVAIADIFDRMTTKRGGFPHCQPFQAIELIVANSGVFFDPSIVKTFIKNIAIFPIGTEVVLNSGEEGIVVESNKEYPTRPKVRILIGSEGQKITPSYDIDLVDNPSYCVIRIVEEGLDGSDG